MNFIEYRFSVSSYYQDETDFAIPGWLRKAIAPAMIAGTMATATPAINANVLDDIKDAATNATMTIGNKFDDMLSKGVINDMKNRKDSEARSQRREEAKRINEINQQQKFKQGIQDALEEENSYKESLNNRGLADTAPEFLRKALYQSSADRIQDDLKKQSDVLEAEKNKAELEGYENAIKEKAAELTAPSRDFLENIKDRLAPEDDESRIVRLKKANFRNNPLRGASEATSKLVGDIASGAKNWYDNFMAGR